MKTTTCRSCGAPVIWTVTSSGSRMLVDAEPVIGGHYSIQDGSDATPRAVYVRELTGAGYVSHFATCPQAKEHRRKS